MLVHIITYYYTAAAIAAANADATANTATAADCRGKPQPLSLPGQAPASPTAGGDMNVCCQSRPNDMSCESLLLSGSPLSGSQSCRDALIERCRDALRGVPCHRLPHDALSGVPCHRLPQVRIQVPVHLDTFKLIMETCKINSNIEKANNRTNTVTTMELVLRWRFLLEPVLD